MFYSFTKKTCSKLRCVCVIVCFLAVQVEPEDDEEGDDEFDDDEEGEDDEEESDEDGRSEFIGAYIHILIYMNYRDNYLSWLTLR